MKEIVMLNFLETINKISSVKPDLSHVQKLQVQLKCLSNTAVEDNDPQLFIECILKYIDFIINISSSKGFRDQIKICRNSFDIITEIVSEPVQTIFVKTMTKKVFDIIIEDDVKNWCIKKELLKAYISCIQRADKNIRQETVRELPNIYLYKMVDSISTYGDYDLQVTLIETVFRMYGRSTITSKLKDLIPESQQLSESFAEINGDTFDEDVRNFLNALNETSGKVFSVICKSVHLGNIKCGEPMENVNGLWVDFNLSENAITWYCNKNSFSDHRIDTEDLNESKDRVWNLITLFVSDVESVQIHRPVKSEDVLIYFKFKESCISSFDDNQEIVGAANNMKLVVSYNSKKVASLLSKVLPYLFKNKFYHNNSSKISSSKKSVYKPLNVSISRRISDSSKTKSDTSKTKSDTSSFIPFFDPTCGKSIKSNLSSTLKEEIGPHKGYNVSSVSPNCEVISILESSTAATELSLEFVSIKDQRSQNVQDSVNSKYETADICSNVHFEEKPKVSKNHKEVGEIKISKPATIDNSQLTHSSFNDEFFNVQEDINRIQILSRRCSGSNVRYSQLSKNSRLTASTPKKLPSFCNSNNDEITENCVHSDQSEENITIWNKPITEESSTLNFETAENGQTFMNATKISKSIESLRQAEKVANGYAQKLETALSQISNRTVKVSLNKNVKIASNNGLNLHSSNEINESIDVPVKDSHISTKNRKSKAIVNKKFHIESDICNLTQEKPEIPIEINVENAIFDNSLRKNQDLATVTDKCNDVINCSKVNQENALLNDNTSVLSSIAPVTEEALTSIAKLNVSDAGNIVNEHTLRKLIVVVENIEINSKCKSNYVKCSTAANLPQKRTRRHKPNFSRPNGVITEESNKENLGQISSLHEIGHSDGQSVEEIIRETDLRKNVKPMQLLPLNNINIIQNSVCHEIEKSQIKDASNGNSIPKQLLVEDYRTTNQDMVINVEEQISPKKKVLVASMNNNSKKRSPEIPVVNNKKGRIIQDTNSGFQEELAQNNIILKSIDRNLKVNQTSNNLNLIEKVTNEANIKKSQGISICNDIFSEDEVPLKQLAEKWKREKLKSVHIKQLIMRNSSGSIIKEHDEFGKTKSNLTDNCEKAFTGLQKDTIIKNSNLELKQMKSDVAGLNGNVISKQGETLKCFVRKSENLQELVSYETKNLTQTLECNKQLDVSRIIANSHYDTDNNGNNKDKIKSNKEILEMKIDQGRNNTQMSEQNYNGSITIDKFDVTKDVNGTVSTTLGGRRKRKLYNPEDLTYLEDSVLDNSSIKLVQIKSPVQPNEENIGLNYLKKIKTTNDSVVDLTDCDVTNKRSCKIPKLETSMGPDGKNFRLDNSKKIKKNNNTVVPLNNYAIKKSNRKSRTSETRKKLKVVNPNTTLNVPNNKSNCYGQLKPVFYNMLESFRKQSGTSFVDILKESIPKKGKIKENKRIKNMTKAKKITKNRSTRIDLNVRTQNPNLSLNSSDLSLNLRKKSFMNGNSDATPPLITNINCHPPEMYIEKNNHKKKINIISDIQIKPKCMPFEDKTELLKTDQNLKLDLKSYLPKETSEFRDIAEPIHTRKVECKGVNPLNIIRETQLPVISESITREEISSWIATGSPKYSQYSERRYVLKHTYPMFESLTIPQDSSQEYKDVLKIMNILKKYC